MVLHVGLDDTDSRVRMCTTFVAAELVRRVRHLDLIGLPRLVRLNPNIPWKTRGNGALALRFGHGRGEPTLVGRVGSRRLRSYPRSTPLDFDEELWGLAREVVDDLADWEAESTAPGLVVSRSRPSPGLYWKAVREIVPMRDLPAHLESVDRAWAPRGPRGLIGACAAIAWRPRDRTYEVLAYRPRARWGSPREVEESDVQALDARFPTTFNNYDREARHMAVVPRSPCPVLLGIRGEAVGDLQHALASVRAEPIDRWLLFETNQGTDEHLQPQRPGQLQLHTSAIVEGTVQARPKTVTGGHVVVSLGDSETAECVAYEPTKSFRKRVRQLIPGDQIRVYGSVREDPRAINLEKLWVQRLAPDRRKTANPCCPVCQKAMKSVGRGAGFRCRLCGTRAGEEAARFVVEPRGLRAGWYEPPVSARRHLGKPLSRMS